MRNRNDGKCAGAKRAAISGPSRWRHVNVALRILDELVNGFLTSRELTQVLAKEDHCSPFKYGQDDCQKSVGNFAKTIAAMTQRG